jgi:ABC-type branched-subunit amino acid transport system ATPase component
VLVEGAIEQAGVATLPSPTEQSIPEQPSAETADAGTQQVEEPSTTSLAERGGGFGTAAPGSSPRPRAEDRSARRPLVEADEVTVRFGGLVAVGGATMSVREGEIVGLIGPNGAGKTTLFNAIAGLVGAADGRVRLFGQDVTELPVHERAKLGVARTFQLIQLFPQLSVFDNLLVATHVHNPTGVLSHVFATPSGLGAEVAVRRRVRRVISAVGLRDVADARVADLPFGVLRMVEVARALVTGFPLIMLDEPASGLDNRETDILGEYLVQMRDRGVTLLLIEHDVALVTAVSDYIYVLERGRLIAEGPPEVIKRDPAVIAAYLGEEDATA